MFFCMSGALFGYVYALFFVSQRRRVFSLYTTSRKTPSCVETFVFPIILRIVLLYAAYYYLLKTDTIHFILTMICSIIGFWIGILKTKAALDGRL